MSELQITDAAMRDAVRALVLALDPDEDFDALSSEDFDEIRTGLTAAAPHLVAAELRRLARDIGNRSDTATPQWVRVQQELGARADELTGGQS